MKTNDGDVVMQCATIYRTSNGYVVHADCQTTAGVWMASDPFIKLPLNATGSVLLRSVNDALMASISGIEHPADWEEVRYPVPELAGAKSWAEFMKHAECVSIERSNESISLVPSENRGPKQGFTPIGSRLEFPIDASEVTLAAGLFEALGHCR